MTSDEMSKKFKKALIIAVNVGCGFEADAEDAAELLTLIVGLESRIAELEAEIDQLTAHSDIERQDDKWIPVSERLPEDGKPVWVCTIWNEQHSGFLIDGVWGGLFRDFREGEITHWMPLPPNPESPNDTQTQTERKRFPEVYDETKWKENLIRVRELFADRFGDVDVEQFFQKIRSESYPGSTKGG